MCVSCYGMALKQQPSVSSLWHDLGVCYYHLMKVVEGHSVKLMAGKCVDSLKQALMIDPNNHSHWNVLGVITAHPGLSSAVCFIVICYKRSYHAGSRN